MGSRRGRRGRPSGGIPEEIIEMGRQRGGRSGAAIIPEEIIEDILAKVASVKSIMRFKTVSKSWFNLIKSRRFVYKHLLNHMNHRSGEEDEVVEDGSFVAICLVVYDTSLGRRVLDVCRHIDVDEGDGEKEGGCCSGNYKWSSFDQLLSLADPDRDGSFFSDSINIDLGLVGICNGIMCFNYYDKVMLVNPSLLEVKTLPTTDDREEREQYNLFGFGFDKTSMDFKVVRIHGHKKKMVHVYSLRSNSWRKLDDDLGSIPFLYPGSDNHPSLDGKVYWYVSLTTSPETGLWERRILSFDLATELFQLIEYPQDHTIVKTYDRLILLNQDSLALVSWTDHVVNLWTMNKNNEQIITWTKLYSIQCPPHLIKPISFSIKHNKFLYEASQGRDDCRLITCDLFNQSNSSTVIFQESQVRQYINNGTIATGLVQAGVCRPSLISLNSV